MLNPFIIYQNGTGLIDKINSPELVALIIKIYNKGYDIIEGFKYLNHLAEEYKKASLRYEEHFYQDLTCTCVAKWKNYRKINCKSRSLLLYWGSFLFHDMIPMQHTAGYCITN